MASEAQRAACKRYYERNKKNTRVIVLRLLKDKDKDVIDALDAEPNKSEYLKRLVRNARKGRR